MLTYLKNLLRKRKKINGCCGAEAPLHTERCIIPDIESGNERLFKSMKEMLIDAKKVDVYAEAKDACATSRYHSVTNLNPKTRCLFCNRTLSDLCDEGMEVYERSSRQ